MLALGPEMFAWSRRQLAQPPAPCACKVCGGESPLFDVVDFHKSCHPQLYPFGLSGIPVWYRRCGSCGFIFTDFFDEFTPQQWTQHVYNADYGQVDPGYAQARPRTNAIELQCFLRRPADTVGLDYGGGNGMTTRLMRDAGWTFDCHDPYGHSDLVEANRGRYDFCSALEVMEHTPQPMQALQSMVQLCSSDRLVLFIGTAVHDGIVDDRTRLSWWYAGPRNGHISLFSREALRRLGARFGLDYASVTRGTHLLTRGVSPVQARAMLVRGKVRRELRG